VIIYRNWDENFYQLYSLLKTPQLDAFYKDATIIVRFNGNTVTVTNMKDSTKMSTTILLIARPELANPGS
jgi:hypothetical protein